MDIQVRGKEAFVANGGRAHDAALPWLVFVHGAAMDHSAWYLQTRYFAYHGFNVAAVDLPGHGRSEGPLIPTIDGMADWLADLLDALGASSATIAGHSMGALTALEFAARHPAKIDKLALLGVANPMPVGQPLLDASKADDHAAFDMITLFGLAKQSQLGGNPTPGLWMSGCVTRLQEESDPGVLFNDFTACNNYQDGEDAATAVDVGDAGSIVIVGAEDRMTAPKSARALAAQIKGAEVSIIPGSGHMMMLETPNEVIAALKTIL
jgi:pimeloyl-ACP methyl ester carboxylesterase